MSSRNRQPGPVALVTLCIGLFAGVLGGCVAPPASNAVRVEAGEYARAFNAAREVLEDRRFRLERVDARAGVITTVTAASGGVVGLGDGSQTSIRGTIEDSAHRQQRRIRIEFASPEQDAESIPEPAESAVAAGTSPEDLRRREGALIARVVVVVERVESPGLRLETSSTRASSVSVDLALRGRGLAQRVVTPIRRDKDLEHRLAEQIRRELLSAG